MDRRIPKVHHKREQSFSLNVCFVERLLEAHQLSNWIKKLVSFRVGDSATPPASRVPTWIKLPRLYVLPYLKKEKGLDELQGNLSKCRVVNTATRSSSFPPSGIWHPSLHKSAFVGAVESSTVFQGNWEESHPPIGEGNSNPLQYSCLENPMEGGAL